ncbi:hypothetical protein EVA_02713 [gut metagenome]|uniref:Uncharacterized protein n=1 Tax=gut metagenome TaxID=749906 RepID=J9GMG5_9ZZZZ
MGIVKTEIGRLPVNRGDYAAGTAYYKFNLVQYLGSTYESLTDNNTTAPAVQQEDGTIRTNANWKVFADASAAVQFDTQLQTVRADVRGLTDSLADASGFREMPHLAGQPWILFGHGAPAKANVPDNWIQFDFVTEQGYDWDGLPSALGQQYIDIDASVNGHYIAVPEKKNLRN